MEIVPYQLANTNDLLTGRAGLITIAQLMSNLGFSNWVNKHFPHPKSNRGFAPSVFVISLMLMLHEGGRCLDDLRHIRNDDALRSLLGMDQVPGSDTVGNWLRRLGDDGVQAVTEVNRHLLERSLASFKNVTLDIDATLSASKNKSAKWSYKKCTGYMPMVGHIVETGQIVATDFREGNVSPSKNNLEFIHQCEEALPDGVTLSAVRIDAAGYQASIIDECIDRDIKFAIRARASKTLKKLILAQDDSAWKALLDRNGKAIEDEYTTQIVHTMGKSNHSFSVVVQRALSKDKDESPDAETNDDKETLVKSKKYIYRAIAISENTELTNSEWIHWYNERGEHSENRIKELKHDFGADRMPCQDSSANAFYFSLCALAFNLFVLMRMNLPASFRKARAKTIRWRVYALAGKLVKHGRKFYLKLKQENRLFLEQMLFSLNRSAQAP